MRITKNILATHGILFIPDSEKFESIPSDTGNANVTFTDTCIAFWVMHEVDGEVNVEITNEKTALVMQKIYSGELLHASGSISLTQPNYETISVFKVGMPKSIVTIYSNDPTNPDTVLVQINTVEK